MTGPFVPMDQEHRLRIVQSLDETLIVEAGAGTGKTRSLVDRLVNLIASGITTLDRVAAITFTEAAAAELRDRVRWELEKGAADPARSPAERRRCRKGVEDLDQAAIQTLHSFAGSLLRERPLEAGLPPAFEVLDEVRADLHFREAWARWLDAALEDSSLAPWLRSAFTLGLATDDLYKVARQFHAEYDLLAEASFADSPAPKPEAAQALIAAVPDLERLCRYARKGEEDPLVAHIRGVARLAQRLARYHPASLQALRLLAHSPPLNAGSTGRQQDWDRDPQTGQNACKAAKELLKGLQKRIQEELEAARRAALVPLLRAVQGFVLQYAQERKRQGAAQFHDLLVWARDLLRDNLEVRDYFRQRYTHLLIDEFQDTDPLQVEIALFLAEDVPPGIRPEARPRHWTDVRPAPGKLFVVGDPKQSIYRFRRAEVALAARLAQVAGCQTVPLVQNFRSQKPIIQWVNHVFERWMEPREGQVDYIPLEHRWEPGVGHQVPPMVHYIGQPLEGVMDQVRRLEAQEIASLLLHIRHQGWPVRDPSRGEGFHQARFQDICILMRSRTGLDVLEEALENAGVPYRIESASLVFHTQEVRDLLNCLRAMDNPADQVALVAALRSPALACSDVDLLSFVEGGGHLDYLSPGKASPGPVAEGLEVLREFHQRRLTLSPSALIEQFIRDRQLMELALDYSRPRERWRRYYFLVEWARTFARAGGTSLRAFLRWVEEQMDEQARLVEAPVPEGDEDAARIMTIHAAKGLEFPIVVLTGINNTDNNRRPVVLVDRQRSRVEVRTGTDKARFQTPGYQELAEWERLLDQEEYIRLMYVAATRARDHLVVSLWRKEGDDSSAAAQFALYLQGHEHLWRPVSLEVTAGGQPSPASPQPPYPPEGDTPERRAQWLKERAVLLEARSRPWALAATTLAQEAKEEQEVADEPWRRGRAGTSLGRAVHAVLQTVDLATGAGLEETARAQATAEGIPEREAEVARLVRNALGSPVLRRAVASGRWWREVPLAAPLGNGVLEGFVDLLFQEDGELVVVDYKTDALETPEELARAIDRYRLQGGAYALALERATGRRVKEVVFLFLQPHREESLKDVAALMEQARQAAQAHLG